MTGRSQQGRIDVAAERAATPGCATGHHFNAAGAALPTAASRDAIVAHLHAEAQLGGYEAARDAQPRLDGVYRLAAAAIGAEPGEIALLESATAGWQRAVAALRLGPGDRVLAARSSYVSSALQLLSMERAGGPAVEVLPSTGTGEVDLDHLERALRAGPAGLVTAAHVPTSSGLVEPVAQIGALCRAHGVPFLLDATQSLGQLDVDVRHIGCDLMVATGRKFLRGPRGTGLLYVSTPLAGHLEPVAPDVRGAVWTGERDWTIAPGARRFELWEAAHALRLGLGVAFAELDALGAPSVAAHLAEQGTLLRERLAALPGVTITDPSASGGAIVTFVVDGLAADDARAELTRRNVHLVSVPAGHGRWDLAARELPSVLRASVHVYNDEADIDALVAAVDEVTRGVAPRRSVSRAPVEPVDAVVLGLGVHGSAAAHELARRGLRVVAFDRFRAGHVRGSSHGASRMIRRAYPDPVWDDLVEQAYAGWDRLERDSGVPLVRTVGGVFARYGGGPVGLRGPGCREIDAAEAARLAPALRLPDAATAVYDPAAGVIDAEAALRVQRALAEAAGADLRAGEPVLGWTDDGGSVTVRTPRGDLRARTLVVCAGPWTAALLPELAPRLDVQRIVNAYFPAAGFAPPRLGAFSVELPAGLLYGIPALDGRGVKIGLDAGPPEDPDAPAGPATAAELELLRELAAQVLPGVGAVGEHLTCRYTMTPDRRFLVGPVPGRPGVLVASACSGHGFKFAPAIGAALADLACGTRRPDLRFVDPARLSPPPVTTGARRAAEGAA
ncbi:N-methyl-L-tryptophan oxidase [Pseudonocardia sp. CA-107938]|uniref:N-methyl-L-tryptophan oxidase n=1 Tax=Pseudonocardia sp. CA-107938 TaxID=3240021 RepID=UPI003D93B944